ncbi:N-acetyl-gamma-glutamyl-phosphate reductase [uncultured Ruminococcus sp.]|uniref:N-acetyl-gamma-glutamyl-phosphate reductase n=1 Tax=Massiliimalia timonensis TaxID=1987501 RepID=UPI000820F8C1|nr:N-acetyl-gamma-glutamyl-phosphate reductase [Massiliimalia timonensis]SCH44028.1 N-acetyl-gamma-glutamyl-phosphate reductase [uncultured Ruminococcus sp.]SCI12531.1 N-acetyl-gamma-glutamyl-phosphate reductase [uncultured Clostridium sp.]
MAQTKVGIIGATGYAGEELVRILLNHPNVTLAAISSVSFEGKKLSEVYPSLYQICDMALTNEDTVIAQSDVIFASLPHGLCEALAKKAVGQGKKFIDLGADFRLKDEADYQQWYGLEYKEKELHTHSCYCIPELHRERLGKDISIIGNPGCYPTSIALGMAPIAKSGLADLNTLVIDSKSGVTGAGRGLSQTTHYPDCNEAFSPYKTAVHRHTPEIEQTLSELSGEPVRVTFVPHLLPVNRGIVSTMYVTLKEGASKETVRALYESAYQNEKFVRVLPDGDTANLKHVKFSNYCDISLHFDSRTNRLIVVSTIDNMVKGAAGQAVQNMNLLCGFEEDAGLCLVPPAF